MVWKSKEYWITVGLILVVGVYVTILRSTSVEPGETPDLSRIPLVIGPWRGEKQALGEAVDEILRADENLYVRYVHPSGKVIWLFLGYFRNQKYGAQIHSPKNCLPGGGWSILFQKRYRLSPPNRSYELPLTQLVISNGREQEVLLYWFETRRGRIANEFVLKIDLLLNSLFYRPTGAAFVRFNMRVENGDTDEALIELEEFVLQLLPSVEMALRSDDEGVQADKAASPLTGTPEGPS